MEDSNKHIEKLAKLFSDAILKIDDSLHFKDFASAVALVLKQDYGNHLYSGFLSQLKQDLKNNTMESNVTNNFDLKKFITENKLTSSSNRVNEQDEQLPESILIQYNTHGRFYGLYLNYSDRNREKIGGVDNANEYIGKLTNTTPDLPSANYAYHEDDVEAAAKSLRELGIKVSHNDDFDTD